MKYAFFGFLGLIALTALVCIGGYVSNANYGVTMETLIQTTYQNNENILAQYGQKVAEVAEVPDMYRDDLIKVTQAAIAGRYGTNGSQAVLQSIKEENPNLDPQLYRQIQEVMESGRNDFQNAQTKLIDIRRQYMSSLGYVWSGFWLKLAGYPKIDLAHNYQPITTERASAVFQSGKEDGPIKLR